jgi:hypothetical protein
MTGVTTSEGPALSPGGFTAPPGTLPAWNWVPPGYGISPRWDRVPWWVQAWYWTPFVDRWAYAWMWRHGGWEIRRHPAGPGEGAGAFAPYRPVPPGHRPRR